MSNKEMIFGMSFAALFWIGGPLFFLGLTVKDLLTVSDFSSLFDLWKVVAGYIIIGLITYIFCYYQGMHWRRDEWLYNIIFEIYAWPLVWFVGIGQALFGKEDAKHPCPPSCHGCPRYGECH